MTNHSGVKNGFCIVNVDCNPFEFVTSYQFSNGEQSYITTEDMFKATIFRTIELAQLFKKQTIPEPKQSLYKVLTIKLVASLATGKE